MLISKSMYHLNKLKAYFLVFIIVTKSDLHFYVCVHLCILVFPESLRHNGEEYVYVCICVQPDQSGSDHTWLAEGTAKADTACI